MIPLEKYLILSLLLFSIGVMGVITRKNAIIIFVCVELMLNAVNLSLIAFSRYFALTNPAHHDGQIIAFLVIAVAAAEAAVGLAIILAMYRQRPTVNIDDMTLMKG
ncbi:MAG: NADH-quinone oxidoreductase subunit NuoK [Deltaproteobacteria bacterium]|nr:MAG: NADH-quinone oxidoreductase subunit NuoK [Deltaproteobacteria bacterium]